MTIGISCSYSSAVDSLTLANMRVGRVLSRAV